MSVSFLKSISGYLLSNVVVSVVPFFLIPILTRYLTPVEYGRIAFFLISMNIITSLISMGCFTQLTRRYFDETGEEYSEYVLASLFIVAVSGMLISVLIYLMDLYTGLPNLDGLPFFWILMLASLMSAYIKIRLNILQVAKNVKSYMISQIGYSLLGAVSTCYLIIYLGLGDEGRYYGILLPSVLYGISSVYLIKKDYLKHNLINNIVILSVLRKGVPLLPHMLSGYLFVAIERYVVNEYLGLFYVGVYFAAFQIGNAMKIFFDAMNKSMVPWLFKKLADEKIDSKVIIVRNTYIYFLILIISIFIINSIPPQFFEIYLGGDFRKAAQLIPYFITGHIFVGMYLMVTNYIFYAEKGGYLSVIAVATGLLHVSILYIMIQFYGLIGAAMAFIITSFIKFLITWILSSRVYSMPWFSFLKLKANA